MPVWAAYSFSLVCISMIALYDFMKLYYAAIALSHSEKQNICEGVSFAFCSDKKDLWYYKLAGDFRKYWFGV